MTPEQLVSDWLVGNGISISNVTFNGSSNNITSTQVGTFTANGLAGAELELEAGIVMTSGTALNAVGPNNTCNQSAATGTGGDPDLNIIAGVTTQNAAVLEFDFVPESDTLQFRYVFGSEEIWFYCYSFNDAFGFFLSGPGINGTFSNNAVNIALMPGTLNWVTLNNMCNFPESMWCNAPVNCPKTPPPPSYVNCQNPKGSGQFLQYNGLTYVYTALYIVTPCSTYHIKLAVGDASDQSLDSGVFLEKNSFSAPGLTVTNNFTIPILGNIAVEGCSNALVEVSLPTEVSSPYTIYYNISGTAINGVDYVEIPDSVVILAGKSSDTIIIEPIYDGITEGIETVILEFEIGGCNSTESIFDTILIADNTPFYINAGPDDTICSGDVDTLSGMAWGGQRPYLYNWVGIGGGDSIVLVSPSAGTHSYSLMVTDGCGVEEYDTMELLVKPTPVVSAGNFSNPICSGEPVVIQLSASVPGSVISWIVFNPSGQVTGYSPGTGNTISQVLINPGYSIDSIRYTIAATADGCTGNDTSIWVYIRPIPDLLFNPTSYELCSGDTTAINLSSHVASTFFFWTASSGNPDISGYNDDAGNAIEQVLGNSGPDSDTVFYHVTATSFGCSSAVTDYPVVVHPVPSAGIITPGDSICSGESTDIQLSSGCTGTSFAWTASQGVGDVTGFNDGTGTWINQSLTNHLTTPGSVLYLITPSTTHCTGQDTLWIQWVKPTPQVTNSPPGDSICNGTTLYLTLASDIPGTTFTWTCTASSPQITGWADQSIPALLINNTLINNGSDIETVVYHITPNHTGCNGPVFNYTVTVYPTPTLTNSPLSRSLCSGQPVGLSLTSDVAGTTFTWRAFCSSPAITGFHNHSEPGLTQIDDTLVNTGYTIDTVTYRILPTANDCPGDSTDYRVVIYPVPNLSNPVTTQSQCSNQPTNITLQSNVAGTQFTWTASCSSSFTTGFYNSVAPGILINQILINSGTEIDTVTYLIVPHANACDGDTTTYLVIVFPVPDVLFIPDGDTLCSSQTTGFALSSQVNGTTFSWTATGSSPNITGYGPGSGNLIQQPLNNLGYLPEWVTYLVIPAANECVGIPNSVMVTVNPLPVVSFPVCFDTLTTPQAQPFELKGAVPSRGTFTGTGVTGSTFYPAIAGAGTHHIRYTYTNNFNCVDSASRTIHIVNPVSYTCGDTLTDPRDNKKYPTVLIGTQCWMANNLDRGSPISSSQIQRDNCVNEKYCFNDNPANCSAYGGLYQWDEVMRYVSDNGAQGLCPPGWHIPTETDWNTLFNFYISNGFAGNALKSSGYSGFNALMTGTRFHNLVWKFPVNDPVLRSKLYWSSTLHGPAKVWAHGMNEVVADIEYTPSVSFYPALQSNAFAVRCIKD